MSDNRDRLNEALRESGFEMRCDLCILRPSMSETMELRPTKHAVIAEMSTEAWSPFAPRGLRLERFRKNPVVLWTHNYDGFPVARSLWERIRGEVESSAGRLVTEVQFHRDTELSREVWALIKNTAGVKWEFGVVPAEWHNKGPVVMTWDLVEISAVPNEECMKEIRQRFKDRRLCSPAMLQSVEGAELEPEPESPARENNTAIPTGPYCYDWRGGASRGEETVWTVYGPGYQRRAANENDAITHVSELNDAFAQGYASITDPSALNAPAPGGVDARVAELERWRRELDRRFAAARRVMGGG